MWIKPGSSALDYQGLFEDPDSAYGLWFRGGTKRLDCGAANPPVGQTALTLYKWHFVVASVSGGNCTIYLDGVPDGYRAMNAREAIKVMVTP
jgi:hypothetical protein